MYTVPSAATAGVVSPHGGAVTFALAAPFAVSARRLAVVSGTGRTLGTVSLGRPLPDGTVTLTIKRSRLARALTEEAERRGIVVHHGRRLVDATVLTDGRVRATFGDGGSAVADLLVGADGVHSAVRRVIDPQAPVGRYVGLTNFGERPVPSTRLAEVVGWPVSEVEALLCQGMFGTRVEDGLITVNPERANRPAGVTSRWGTGSSG